MPKNFDEDRRALLGITSVFEEDDSFIGGSASAEAQQDAILDDMSALVGRLGNNSKTMGSILSEHKVMIGEMDDQIDTAQTGMQFAERGMQRLLKKSGCNHFCCILGLFAVIVFELLLIVYT
mmetsp:Transcript_15026/g.29542  ORF Transcript_15026/g.29542 Transcript_15026/m.29542 type:complete len:122 (-) Transcript_15026:549-914(-)